MDKKVVQSGSKKWWWIGAIGIVIVIAFFDTGADKKPLGSNNPEPFTERSITVTMVPRNNSNEEGSVAFVTTEKTTVKVRFELMNAPAGQQPANIHQGTCETIGEAKYPLTSLVNGVSETTIVGSSVEDLVGMFPLVASVQRSATDTTSVSCAPLVRF